MLKSPPGARAKHSCPAMAETVRMENGIWGCKWVRLEGVGGG